MPLLLDAAGTADAPACSPVLDGAALVGLTSSGVWSHTLGRSVALAYVRNELAQPGRRLEVEVLGERRAATVAQEPLYDPEHRRSRA